CARFPYYYGSRDYW
nr:immunoglobulin heavy chain junction region [Mus musculus]MBK4183675.1 immunoglobulin heavy chain junction region [Mus musculus]